jgi:hydroxymethylpyrimidine/phosphomethylpyrimidine kinase
LRGGEGGGVTAPEGRPPRILIIAGSDSGGGAGIQADIKTVTMLGGHAMTAVTAITAQNTLGVTGVWPMPAEAVIAQIDAGVSDLGVDAVKIGMIGSAEVAEAVAERLERLAGVPTIFDPVMVATSGSVLADEATIAAFGRLMRIATLVTPNLPELAVLSSAGVEPSRDPSSSEAERPGVGDLGCARSLHRLRSGQAEGDVEDAAVGLARRCGVAVLAKGGHGDGDTILDLLATGEGVVARWDGARIETRHSHGTGCTLASGIATGLGAGLSLVEAIGRAREYVRAALLAAPRYGAGHGPMGHGLGGTPFDLLRTT